MPLGQLSLSSLFASMSAMHLATAALGTLVALQLAESGGSQEFVSLVAASYSLGFLLGCFYSHKPIASVGYIRAFAGAAALCAIFALLMSRTDSSGVWLAARFTIGLGTAVLYSVGESWINESAPSASRGSILSVYSIALGVASVCSQGLVNSSKSNYSGGFILVAIAFCLSIVVLVFASAEQPKNKKKHAEVRMARLSRYSPTAFIGAFVLGVVVTVFLSVLPFKASTVGISAEIITISISMAYAGRILLQYPLGRISDRMDRRIVIVGISLVASAVLLLISLFISGDGSALQGTPTIGVRIAVVGISLLLGGTLLPLYAILMAHAVDRTDPVFVASTAVTMLFVFTLGGVAGPIFVAVISALFGDEMMDWALFLLLLSFGLFSAWRISRRVAVSRADQAEMRPATATSVESLVNKKR